jgi:hypothetical protein
MRTEILEKTKSNILYSQKNSVAAIEPHVKRVLLILFSITFIFFKISFQQDCEFVSRKSHSSTLPKKIFSFSRNENSLFSLPNFHSSQKNLVRKTFPSNKRLRNGNIKMEYKHIHLIHPNKTMKRNRKKKLGERIRPLFIFEHIFQIPYCVSA